EARGAALSRFSSWSGLLRSVMVPAPFRAISCCNFFLRAMALRCLACGSRGIGLSPQWGSFFLLGLDQAAGASRPRGRAAARSSGGDLVLVGVLPGFGTAGVFVAHLGLHDGELRLVHGGFTLGTGVAGRGGGGRRDQVGDRSDRGGRDADGR